MNRHRTIICVLAFFVVLLIPLLAQAAPEAKQAAPLGIHSEVMKPAGEYVVYVLKEGEWKEAGKLSFDQYFRQKEMDLSKYITGDGNVKIRLVEKGGGAAHIDAVLLGERPPVEVKGIDDVLALKKLSKKDFDVVDAFEKSMELAFPASGTTKIMILTARVEGTRISETPFHFPFSNLYKDMNVNSEFYHYRLAENPGENETPFFKEYCVTGSGHPSGYTYGWVSNDNQNLYVRMDFTPDDTMDGDKDYAKVYVKTEEGIREFKESVPETKWGNPDFTYTDKVEYQHKVYDFTIPLKDVGVKDIKEGKELLLAFAAYGTATPPPHIGVTKAVSCAPQSGVCDDTLTYAPNASGLQGASCPNFCYKIQVSNDGGEDLINVTINDPDLPGLTVPSSLAIGQTVTNFASKTWCTEGSPHVNTVTASGQGSISGNSVSSTATASVTVGSLGLDSSITLTSAFDLDGVPNDNHVTLPGGSTDVPVDVTLTLHNSGLGDQNISVSLPGLVNCLDLTTPILIPLPLAFIASGASVTIDMGCLLVSCPAGMNLTVPAVGSAVANAQFPCVYDNTGALVTVNTTSDGQVSCQSSPAIATSATNASGASTTISDSATLSGGYNPTGSVTFKLYGPSATASCTNLVVTYSIAVNGNGTYGPVSFSPAATGNYYWVASYSGDANNNAVSSACGDFGETSTVSPGLAKVVKTVSGQPPTGAQAFTFQLRQGADTTSDGTILEELDANSADSWTIDFTTHLVPGQHYQLCEMVLPFWNTDLAGDGPLFVPNSIIPPSLPNQSANDEIVCTDFTATSGQTRTFTVDNVSTCGIVTDSSLCPFDVDKISGDQFRLVLTPDQNNQLTWKLNASNPGQFYYNVFYFGPGSTTLNITLPYPFVTQGAVPIHVYDSVTTESVDGRTCFTPGTEIANYSTQVTLVNYSPQQFGSTAVVAVDVPGLTGDFAYINIHLDYGLKGTTGWMKGGTSGIDAISKLATPLPTIENLQSYTFSDPAGCSDTLQSENAFKRDPGIGGLVLADGTEDPAPNAEVLIYDSRNRLLATVHTDKDGWYMWQYKYTGKATTLTVKLPQYKLAKNVTLKSNGFLVVNFTVPQINP